MKGNYVYVTMWDRLGKRPRRFYLGRIEDLEKFKEMFGAIEEYRVTEEEVKEYLEFYLDRETNMTKADYVLEALELGVRFWPGVSGRR